VANVKTHYEVLGVTPTATEREIVQAYRILIRQHHPDRVGPSGEEATMRLNHAYDVLSDPAQRRPYDRSLPKDEPASPASAYAPPTPPAAPHQARESPTWVQHEPGESYATQTSTQYITPTKQEWSTAFPPGSKIRIAFLALGVLTAAGGVALTFASGAQESFLFGILSIIGGLLIRTKKPHWIAYAITAALIAVGVFTFLSQTWLIRPAALGIVIAGIGWVCTSLSERSWGRLRNRHIGSRAWIILQGVCEAVARGPFWVQRVENGFALIEDANTGDLQTVHAWGSARAGEWVALNSAGMIVETAPGAAHSQWVWVQKDIARRLARAVRRDERTEVKANLRTSRAETPFPKR
jgi:hypothetical protein